MKRVKHADNSIQFPRLAFYRHRADRFYWNEYWRKVQVKEVLDDYFWKRMFRKELPKKGKLLEAGCGLGQYVGALTNMGFDVEGVDFSRLAMEKAKNHNRNLSYTTGDVLSLPYRSCSFSGCISLGVVEHFEDGPENVICELNRVLSNGGVLLISVPFFNPLRTSKSRIGWYLNPCKYKEQVEFYQYAFTITEFRNILRNCGFVTHKVVKFDVFDGLREEIPGLNWVYNLISRFDRAKGKTIRKHSKNPSQFLKNFMLRIIDSRVLCEFVAHMALFIAKKEITGYQEIIYP